MEFTCPSQVVLTEDQNRYKVTLKDGVQTDPIPDTWRSGGRHSRRPALKKSCWREWSAFVCLLVFNYEPLESHVPRLALSAMQYLPPHPQQDAVFHPPLPHKMNGESENPAQDVLDSHRHESSCNIGWLGRGVFYPSLLWSSCTTQADNWGSGWDHKSSNGRTLGPWTFKRRGLRTWCPGRSWTVMLLILCLFANFLKLWSQNCPRTLERQAPTCAGWNP